MSSYDSFAARRRAAAEQQRRQDNMIRAAWVIGIIVVLFAVGAGCNAYFGSTREVTARINKTDACGHRDKNGCTQLVYTDQGVFKDSDSFVAGKFNSSDVMGTLCPGGVYKLKVRGYRNGFMNMWPNILKVEQVVTPAPAGSGCTN